MGVIVRTLLVLLFLGAGPANAESPGARQATIVPVGEDGVQRISMVLDSYSYAPDHLIVQAGKPVELILTSITRLTPHNFVLKDEVCGSLDRT